MSGSRHSGHGRPLRWPQRGTGGSACPRRRPIASTWCACCAPIPRPRRWSGCAVVAGFATGVAAAHRTEPHWDGCRVELRAELQAELDRVRCGAPISRGQLCQRLGIDQQRHTPAGPRPELAAGSAGSRQAPGSIPSLRRVIGGSLFSSRSWRAESCPGSQVGSCLGGLATSLARVRSA